MSNDICSCSPLRRLTRRMTVIYDQHLLADELTITQYSLISRIGRNGPVANIELAVDMGMDRSTLSRALKPLIAAGWIETVDLPEDSLQDKRSFALQLTAAGRKKLDRARPNWRRAQDEIDRQLGAGLSRELTAMINDAYARLQDA
ncbi:MarR family transcriptional regulator [Herbaspirillum sp. WKF16]|jgi:DNA-binding MarR family transcriptional regulator|uniref:MarR family winged helix-turn-helix transcriptional regulator n=1 Tax=Herbaspirillum sp. WKF16 TaxID=3028312 RepID=UPI0023AA07E0|nr:MarR family transcriptional regulator [Herbaspirillum sp. WKF16]WDZ97095.1 MarR family transcriptional regulator [Herbaspirillum sp. WKF16]